MAGIGSERPFSTSARSAGSTFSSVLSKAHPRELPARGRREEAAVAGARMAAWSRAAGALQQHLAAHELAIIFANRALLGLEAGVGKESRAGPLPHIAERPAARFGEDRAGLVQLVAEARVGRTEGGLPLRLGRQA